MLREDASPDSLLDGDLATPAQALLDRPPSLEGQPVEFGPYRILRTIGSGGMGVVYLAERADLASQMAIKVLRDASLSPARRERFLAEQRMLAQMHHPFIARIYDAGDRDDGTLWFVMEYVDGLPLTTFAERHYLTIPDRLRLFRSVCEAVQHAHRHAIIHRDLKPSNILVTADRTVKLLDFGIAKQLEDVHAPADPTRTGLQLMTPAYAAPERIRGGRVGVFTDIYSLGVILYELLAGHLPFDLAGKTPGEAESIILEQAPERPSVAAMRIGGTRARRRVGWEDLDVLCLTAMHKDPQRRYRTVDALLRDVGHYLAGEPLEARPDTMGYRLSKFVRRRWRGVTVSALLLAGVVGLVTFYSIRLAHARNAAVADAARAERIQHFLFDLFQGGDQAAGPADSLRVVTLLDRGVQTAQTLSSEPEAQADLYSTLGGVFQKLGNLDRADTMLQAALAIRRRVYGDSAPQLASSLVELGLLRVEQAQPDTAEYLVRTGLALSRRGRPVNQAAVARSLAALGTVLEDKGDFPQAIAMLDESVRIGTAVGAPLIDVTASKAELANSHFYSGHYQISDSLNRQLLETYRTLYGPRHPMVADALINLGASQFDQGHYAGAERFDQEALGITRAWYGADHPETASLETILARALIAQDHFAEGVPLLQHALQVSEKTYGKVHPQVASALNELGIVAIKQERYPDAEGYFSRMADIYGAVYGKEHYRYALALANLASVYLAEGDNRRAETMYRHVLDLYAKALPPNHLNAGVVHIKLGRSLLRQGKMEDARRETLAGYDIVRGQATPSIGWLQGARKDLIDEYDALGKPDSAARFRAELADSATSADVRR